MASAAYRSGSELVDQRTGQVHDYTRRGGVVSTEILLADGSSAERNELWNAAEAAEKRKDARTGREWIVALPAELDEAQRQELAIGFGVELASRYGVAVDVAIHLPDREGDNRNHHAHVMTTTRQVHRAAGGGLVIGDKVAIELSDSKRRERGLGPGADEVKAIRQLWERMTNRALEQAGSAARIDARSLKAQGIDREATTHLGPVASDMERRHKASDRGDGNRKVAANNRKREQLSAQVIDLDQERQRRAQAAQAKLSPGADWHPGHPGKADPPAWSPEDRSAARERHSSEPRLTKSAALRARIAAIGTSPSVSAQDSNAVPQTFRERMTASTERMNARFARLGAQAPAEASGSVGIKSDAQLKSDPVKPVSGESALGAIAATQGKPELSAARLELDRLKASLVPPEKLVAADPAVVAAKHAYGEAVANVEQAKRWVKEIPEQEAKWRAENRIKAALHDKGIKKSPELEHCAKALGDVNYTLRNERLLLQNAEATVNNAEYSALWRVRQEMNRSPAMQRIEHLERIVQAEQAKVSPEVEQRAPRPAKTSSRPKPSPARHRSIDRDEPGMDFD